MRRFELIIVAVGTIAILGAGIGASQEKQFSISQLGPDPFPGAPESIGKLVNDVPAAVIAEIVGPGKLKFEEVAVPHSTKLSLRGYATYKVIIRDVIFNRLQQNAPPLAVGSVTELLQDVGRESAEAFSSGRIPVSPGDECLLFLWLRPHSWETLKWHVQFRKSHTIPTAAEVITKSSAIKSIGPKWLGGSVPYALDGDEVLPDWTGLVGEVRRLANQPTKR